MQISRFFTNSLGRQFYQNYRPKCAGLPKRCETGEKQLFKRRQIFKRNGRFGPPISDSQKLPPRFSSVSITTTQSSWTVCITSFIRFSGIATQPPV